MIHYLASPYTNDPEGNYEDMVIVLGKLLRERWPATFFSPVVHFHPVRDSLSYEFAMHHCLNVLSISQTLIVVKLLDWQNSKGVKTEMDFWRGINNKAIYLMDSITLVTTKFS